MAPEGEHRAGLHAGPRTYLLYRIGSHVYVTFNIVKSGYGEMATQSIENPRKETKTKTSREIITAQAGNELFFAVVGPVGAGSSRAAKALKGRLEAEKVDGVLVKCEILKASDVIRKWAEVKGRSLPPTGQKTIDAITMMQNYGDEMREADNAAVAVGLIQKIAETRALLQKQQYIFGHSVEPDGSPKAFILDSLKHPAEARLLRSIYGDAFALIGVVCGEGARERRLTEVLFRKPEWKKMSTKKAVQEFMKRDADDHQHKFGQHVTDVFHEADFFVDNTPDDNDNEHQLMNEPFGRLIDIITHSRIHRPTTAETAMHVAHTARLRSACLSRQVGAALVDRSGNVVATGTNEVPMAGGGVYGEDFRSFRTDSRCAFCSDEPECSNNREQNEIIQELVSRFPELLTNRSEGDALLALRQTSLGSLIEFSRAVHAEMDAILSASRAGVSPVGCRLFVTTFPCHYCARHIVSAGVYEVQYIEPYPKSKALGLHSDAIATDPFSWVPPDEADPREDETRARRRREQALNVSKIVPGDPPATPIPDEFQGKVLFHPFVGVAPKMYPRAFLKDRDYKDKVTGKFQLGRPDWGSPWSLHRLSYHELEARLG